MKKKLLSMLVLLLTVTTGAWAQFSTSKGEVLSKSKAVKAFRAPIHKAPSQNDGWYYYDNGSFLSGTGTNTETIYWGILFPAESLDGSLLRKVSVCETSEDNTEPITIYIYSGGATPNQGTLLYEETVETEHANAFHEIELQTPVSFNPAENLWVVLSEDGDYPASACENTGDANGRWISADGENWFDIADYVECTWMLRAYITRDFDYKFTEVPAEHGSGTVKFYIGDEEVQGAMQADEGKTVTVKVTPDEGWIVDEDNVTAALLYNNWENAGARRATDGEPANNVPIRANIALNFVNKENGVWTFTFTQPASSVRISPKYLKVSTLYFNPADKTELMEVKVDGKVANPIQEGKITPVLENTPVNLKANRGYVFRSVEVVKTKYITLNLNSPAVGQVIGSDGKNYDVGSTLPSGVTALARICYLGSETGDATYNHGLALALTDESESLYWNPACEACSAKNTSTPITNARWMLPSKNQWNLMFTTAGGASTLRDSFSDITGASNMNQWIWYWSSTDDGDKAWDFYPTTGEWECDGKTQYPLFVRAVLVF